MSCVPGYRVEMSPWRKHWKNCLVTSVELAWHGYSVRQQVSVSLRQFSKVTRMNLGLFRTSEGLSARAFCQLRAKHPPHSTFAYHLLASLLSKDLSYTKLIFFYQAQRGNIRVELYSFLKKKKKRVKTKMLVGQGGWWCQNWRKKCPFRFAKTLQFLFQVTWCLLRLNNREFLLMNEMSALPSKCCKSIV